MQLVRSFCFCFGTLHFLGICEFERAKHIIWNGVHLPFMDLPMQSVKLIFVIPERRIDPKSDIRN